MGKEKLLLGIYNKELTDFEKASVELCSILYEPISQTGLMRLLHIARVKDELDKTPYNKSVRVVKERLLEKEIFVLENDYSSNFECNPVLTDAVLQDLIPRPEFQRYLTAVRQEYPVRRWYYRPETFNRLLREIRLAIFQKDYREFNNHLREAYSFFPEEIEEIDIYEKFFDKPFNSALLEDLPYAFQAEVIDTLVYRVLANLESPEPYKHYLQKHLDNSQDQKGHIFRSLLASIVTLQGDSEGAAAINKKDQTEDPAAKARMAWLHFLKGANEEAIDLFRTAHKEHRKKINRKKFYFAGVYGLFYPLALLKTKDLQEFREIEAIHDHMIGYISELPYAYLRAVWYAQQNNTLAARDFLSLTPENSWEVLMHGLACYWVDDELLDQNKVQVLISWYEKAQKNGYLWFQLEFAALLAKIDNAEFYSLVVDEIFKKTGYQPLINIVDKLESWQLALRALESVVNTKTSGRTDADTRLVWLVDFEKNQIQPKEQKISKNGSWTKGRNVALKRLAEGGVDNMTQQDYRIAGALTQEYTYNNYGYGSYDLMFDMEKAYQGMVGHPLLFLMKNPSVAVELVKRQPELIVEEKGDNYEVRFSLDITHVGVQVIKETPTRYNLVEVTEQHLQIATALGKRKLNVPEKAKEELVNAIGKVSSIINVQSAVGEQAEDLPKVEGDPKIHVHLLPVGDGIKLDMLVKPFVTDPPYFKPGKGGENVISEIRGERTLAQRNLKQEEKNAKAVREACPTLADQRMQNYEWSFEEPEDCLQVLLELDPLRENDAIVLEWPKGEKLRITHHADFSNLSLRIQRDNDWFGMEGQLKLNDNLVMNLQDLLRMIDRQQSDFVQISEGKYLALTNAFRKRLEEVSAFMTETKDGMRFHNLAAAALEGFTDNVEDIEADKAWQEQIDRLKTARTKSYRIPKKFNAELRSYQKDGYQWLRSLADWGVGACLADDMGLGKTVQALAVLQSRADGGPALVIAPASVARNWLREAEKFTPDLNAHLFGKGDRAEMLDNLGAKDVLIASYGLLQQEAELFADKAFHTIILDEAQAIKNSSTKRSKSAMQLQGDFKVITTGTPIENHLGELWNLFRFLNPGLLGSFKKFQEKFAIPIERYENKERQQHLKKLIQPFILRRRKSDVLSELPEKTEVTLSVELSPEEASFYEAVRQNALENLSNNNVEGGQGQLRILAEIMRLRRTCCHPQLVSPDVNIQSSKLQLFGEIVEELLENDHKALVFSQFVGHLKLIEEYVQSKNIPYQYLDGQTPLKKREDRINAFQNGEGDLFLISLKAGGVGLNLTAADYVIHMDPWWNPAVEDQASDRAHRIGQRRPVTVYRLVTEGTIEEKIVKLHQTKRDLADSLLEGTDSSGRLSADELLDLIRQN